MANIKLKMARRRKHWTIEDAAEKAGVSERSYRRWERGTHQPRLSSLEMLCEAFGVSSAEELGFDLSLELPEDDDEKVKETLEKQQNGIILLTSDQVALLKDVLLGENVVAHFDITKRKALKQLMAALSGVSLAPYVLTSTAQESWSRLEHESIAVMDETSFFYFYDLLEGCWGIGNNGDMQLAGHITSSFLPKILHLAQSHKDAAILAAQGLRLLSLVKAHLLEIPAMIPLCQQSVEYARMAGEPNILSASLNGLAVAYKYNNNLEASFRAYQEALCHSDQASPLLKTRVYAGAAAAFATQGRMREADFYIHMAFEDFPDHPEADTNYLSADNGIYMLAYYHGLSYLTANEPKKAIRAFEEYKAHPTSGKTPERNRLEIINHMAKAAIMMNDMDQSALYLEEGLAGALKIHSEKRYDEAVSIFKAMPKTWVNDQKIKQIRERYQLSSHLE